MSIAADSNSLQKTALQICAFVLDRISDEHYSNDVSLEIWRIVSSNIVISAAVDVSVEEVTRNPNLGIREFSSKSMIDFDEIIDVVRGFGKSNEYSRIKKNLEDFTKYQLTKILEHIHVMTVYEKLSASDIGTILSGSNGKQKLRGAFYTPTHISEFICEGTIGTQIDSILSDTSQLNTDGLRRILDCSIVDPACGPGVFLVESFRVFERRYPRIKEVFSEISGQPEEILEMNSILKDKDSFLDHIACNLYGVDIDSTAVEVASVCIAIVSGAFKHNLKVRFLDSIKAGNSLVSELPPKIFLHDRNLHDKMCSLRQDITKNQDYSTRKSDNTDYRELIRNAETNLFVHIEGKRASEILNDDDMTHAFCWELEFPEIFSSDRSASGGFDYLVMNPPYDLLKLNKSEYISEAQNSLERSLAISEFETEKAREQRRSAFFKESGQYKLSIDRMLNLYRLMIERALQITTNHASVGCIVPSTILGDGSAAKIRSTIIQESRILGIDDFSEHARVFDGITQAVSIIRFERGGTGKEIPLATHETREVSLNHGQYHQIPVSLIDSISGNLMTIPRCSSTFWPILEKIHSWPAMESQEWIVNRRGELDLTLYKQFITSSRSDAKLVRGNHISRYELKWSPEKKESFVHKDAFLDALGASEKRKHIDMFRIAGQQISNMAQKWRLKFALVEPGLVLGNSCNYLIAKHENENRKKLMYLLGIMNSHLMNWRFKITSTNNHVNNSDLAKLPIVPPVQKDSEARQIVDTISECAEKLSAEWDSKCAYLLEASVFKLYGVSREEASTILHYRGADTKEISGILDEIAYP